MSFLTSNQLINVTLFIMISACARIGAPHSVVFGGFSAESLSQRILQGKSRVVVTADAVFRGPKLIALKVCCIYQFINLTFNIIKSFRHLPIEPLKFVVRQAMK